MVEIMTEQQLEHKKKIVFLILLVLAEKAKKVTKIGDLGQVIETAIDLVAWSVEYARLLRKKPFKLGGTVYTGVNGNFENGEDVIPNYLKNVRNSKKL